MTSRAQYQIPAALFLLSMGTVLYSLALFRLISFFIMPSLFFDLLLVCFPIGAAIATRFGGNAGVLFARAITPLQIVMVLTVGVTLLLKHVDYMRENLLFHVDPARILLQIGIFFLIYSPFFIAYGAVEYLGYLHGRSVLKRQMNAVYAIFLFGAAAAFVISLLQEVVGVSRLLIIAVGFMSLSKLVVQPAQRARRIAELCTIAGVLVFPATDRYFMHWFKSSKPMTLADYRARSPGPTEVIHSGWGKYAYFEVLQQQSPHGVVNVGFYNDTSQWLYRQGRVEQPDFRDAVLTPFVRGERAAVIGAGGGRDIKLAHHAGVAEIVAIEIEPAVPRVIRGQLSEQFENIYDTPGVTVVVGDARSFFENTSEQFDIVFFWSVGGYPQLMLEPGNMIRTYEALETFVGRLSDQGVFAIGYDAVLDPERILLRQYATTLKRLGAHLAAFANQPPGQAPLEYMLLALSPNAPQQELEQWRAIIEKMSGHVAQIPIPTLIDPLFTPVTDDRPYLAGNIRNILTPEQVKFLLAVLGGIVATVGIAGFVVLMRGLPNRPGRSAMILLTSLLLGANFLILEHVVVLEIFRIHYVYYDAVLVGVTSFLTITAVGSYFLRNGAMLVAAMVATPIAVALVIAGSSLGSGSAAGLIVLTVVTGGLFPSFFDANPSARLSIFAMDAVGSATGSLMAFFVPILYGFAAFRVIGLVVFAVTAAMLLLSWRRSES